MADILEPKFPTTRFSIKWIKSQCRPNMKLQSHDVIISILETGLLFREDSLQIEDILQIEYASRERNRRRKLVLPQITSGEKVFSAVAIGVCIALIPLKLPINNKSNLIKSLCWAGTGLSVPILHRWLIPNTLPTLLQCLTEYTTLVRKCLACIKEQSIHSKSHWNVSIDAINSLLLQQHKELCTMFNNIITTLQNMCPWLSSTYKLWEEPLEISSVISTDSLMKLHHLYLILQSTFLKSIAMIHFNPPTCTYRLNRNHNEKMYWIHSSLLPHMLEPVQDFVFTLNNAYGYFKDHLNREITHKTLPKINREPWQYSEVHASIVLCSSEIRSAMIKANEMDTFLEACWNAKSKFSPSILEEDLAKLKEDLVKCFATIDNTAVQLRKIRTAEMKLLEQAVQKLHLPAVEEEEIDTDKSNIKSVSEDTELDIKDQVFYFEKTDDVKIDLKAEDYLTGPGKAEIQATKIVLGELKRKLVKREDEMRHREAIALEDTMPEYKGNIPSFPRQILIDNLDENVTNGEDDDHNNVSSHINNHILNVEEQKSINGKIDLVQSSEKTQNVIKQNEAFNKMILKNVNIQDQNNHHEETNNNDKDSLKSFDSNQENKEINDKTENFNFHDLQSASTSNAQNKKIEEQLTDDSDFSDFEDTEKLKLLKDIRKNRVSRKKNHPSFNSHQPASKENSRERDTVSQKNEVDCENEPVDEGLEPMEYTFGTGMAMASLLHISRPINDNANGLHNGEEVFIGDGEVSEDSGNET